MEDRLAEFAEPLRAGGHAAVSQVRRRPPLTDEKLVKDLGDSLLRIRERNLKRQVQQLEFLIRESTEAEDRDESRRLHELMATYTAQKRHIQKLLNNRSIAGVSGSAQADWRGLSQKGEAMPSNAERRRSTPRARTDAPKEAPARATRRTPKAARPPELVDVLTADDPKIETDDEDLIEVRVALGPDGVPLVLPDGTEDGKVPAIERDIKLEQEVEREARETPRRGAGRLGRSNRHERPGADVSARDRADRVCCRAKKK